MNSNRRDAAPSRQKVIRLKTAFGDAKRESVLY
jgi:hypothetical protein